MNFQHTVINSSAECKSRECRGDNVGDLLTIIASSCLLRRIDAELPITTGGFMSIPLKENLSLKVSSSVVVRALIGALVQCLNTPTLRSSLHKRISTHVRTHDSAFGLAF